MKLKFTNILIHFSDSITNGLLRLGNEGAAAVKCVSGGYIQIPINSMTKQEILMLGEKEEFSPTSIIFHFSTIDYFTALWLEGPKHKQNTIRGLAW